MGQTLRRILEWEEEVVEECEEEFYQNNSPIDEQTSAVAVAGRILQKHRTNLQRFGGGKKIPNLTDLPPELGILVLSHLNATDLCLAACVWQKLAEDEILWSGLCRSTWQYTSIYSVIQRMSLCHDDDGNFPRFSYRRLYMLLDEASLTFNADPEMGIEYLCKNNLLNDSPEEIARFFNGTNKLHKQQRKSYLERHNEVLEHLVQLQDFNGFLPNRLREFFSRICHAPNARNEYLTKLIEQFSNRFTDCNSSLGLNKDTIFILCYSLIMLSVDLGSPHVKNKMSKREFIRNLRHAVPDVNDEYTGHLYDNVYLVGHIIPQPVN